MSVKSAARQEMSRLAPAGGHFYPRRFFFRMRVGNDAGVPSVFAMNKKTNAKAATSRGRYWYNHEQFADWVAMLGGRGQVADRLGLSVVTVEKYCTGRARIPKATYVLLELLTTGHLALVMGKEWGDIRLTPGGLQLPGWRRPFSPGELHSIFVLAQGRRTLESQLYLAKRDLETATRAAEEWEQKARFYRNQLVLESKMGMMLMRVADS